MVTGLLCVNIEMNSSGKICVTSAYETCGAKSTNPVHEIHQLLLSQMNTLCGDG